MLKNVITKPQSQKTDRYHGKTVMQNSKGENKLDPALRLNLISHDQGKA